MHGKGVWCSDGLNMKLSGANCHAFFMLNFDALPRVQKREATSCFSPPCPFVLPLRPMYGPLGPSSWAPIRTTRSMAEFLVQFTPADEFWVGLVQLRLWNRVLARWQGCCGNVLLIQIVGIALEWPNSEVKSLPFPIVSVSFDVLCRYTHGKQIL